MKSCFDMYHVKMLQEYDGHSEKCEKVDFNSNFSFYFKILAINDTENRECVHNLSLN